MPVHIQVEMSACQETQVVRAVSMDERRVSEILVVITDISSQPPEGGPWSKKCVQPAAVSREMPLEPRVSAGGSCPPKLWITLGKVGGRRPARRMQPGCQGGCSIRRHPRSSFLAFPDGHLRRHRSQFSHKCALPPGRNLSEDRCQQRQWLPWRKPTRRV